MARVRFEPSGYETEMASGAAFIDLTDEHPEAEVPYSCRSASCGTCRVRVKQGAEAMLPPEDDELEVLEIFGDEGDVRLCCQLKLAKETDLVVLEVCDP